MNNQQPANNNPSFEGFLENLQTLSDEQLQSIYGGKGNNNNKKRGGKGGLGFATCASVSAEISTSSLGVSVDLP